MNYSTAGKHLGVGAWVGVEVCFFFPFVLLLGYRPSYKQRYENHET